MKLPNDKPFMKSQSLSLYKNYRNKVVSKVRKAKGQYNYHIDNKICKNEHSSTSWWNISGYVCQWEQNSNGTLFTVDSKQS